MPSSLTLGVPFAEVGSLYYELLEAHRKHLPASIEAGAPTHMNKHDVRLRQYLLDEADRLAPGRDG